MEFDALADIAAELGRLCRAAERVRVQIKEFEQSSDYIEKQKEYLLELQAKIDEHRKYIANY